MTTLDLTSRPQLPFEEQRPKDAVGPRDVTSVRRPKPLSGGRSRRGAWTVALLAPIVLGPAWLWLASPALANVAPKLSSLTGMVLLLALATSAVTDTHGRKIFNWVTYSSVLWALALSGAAALVGAASVDGAAFSLSIDAKLLSPIGLGQSIAGLVICFGVMLVPYSLARGGAGDVKHAAAIGALVGWETGLLALAASYIIAGAVMGTIVLARNGVSNIMHRFVAPLIDRYPMALNGIPRGSWMKTQPESWRSVPVPLGGFFAVGTLLALLLQG